MSPRYEGLKIYGDRVFLPFLQENMNHKDTAAGHEQCSDKSDKERLQLLMDMRDDSLEMAARRICDKKPTGVSSAMHIYEQSCLHVTALENKPGSSKTDLSIAGMDRSNYVFSPDTVIVQKEPVTA